MWLCVCVCVCAMDVMGITQRMSHAYYSAECADGSCVWQQCVCVCVPHAMIMVAKAVWARCPGCSWVSYLFTFERSQWVKDVEDFGMMGIRIGDHSKTIYTMIYNQLIPCPNVPSTCHQHAIKIPRLCSWGMQRTAFPSIRRAISCSIEGRTTSFLQIASVLLLYQLAIEYSNR